MYEFDDRPGLMEGLPVWGMVQHASGLTGRQDTAQPLRSKAP